MDALGVLMRDHRRRPSEGVPGRYGSVAIGPNGVPLDDDYFSEYSYDSTGRLNRVTGPGLPAYGAVYSFLADSDMVAGHTFNSDETTVVGEVIRTLEPQRNLVASIENKWGATTVSKYAYESDAVGRRTRVVNTGSAFTTYSAVGHNRYTYNARDELDRSQRFSETDPQAQDPTPVSGRDFDYAYDPIGNRESVSIDQAAATTYTANNLNQYDATANPSETFIHDDDGNTYVDGSYVYLWDAENRLKLAQPDPVVGAKRLEFKYDYLGRRIRNLVTEWDGSQWSAVADRKFVYDQWNLLLELDGADSDAVDATYTWGRDLSGSLHGAGGTGDLLGTHDATADDDFVYCYDANGNVGQLVDIATGTIGAHYEYDPYGGQLVATGMHHTFNPFRFSTKYFDGELDYAGNAADGLYYYGYRYYSPRLGRWMSRDPLEERDASSLYVFVVNNPINTSDPFGLWHCGPCTAVDRCCSEWTPNWKLMGYASKLACLRGVFNQISPSPIVTAVGGAAAGTLGLISLASAGAAVTGSGLASIFTLDAAAGVCLTETCTKQRAADQICALRCLGLKCTCQSSNGDDEDGFGGIGTTRKGW